MGIGEKKVKSKLGVFGGTFDPVHIGHLIAAEETRMQLQLDEVMFLPAGEPWLKSHRDITPAEQRLAMVKLAVQSNPSFRASDLEIRRPGPTYTVDTLEDLTERLGDESELYLTIGMDALKELSEWKRPSRLFELSKIIAVSRPGYEDYELDSLENICRGASARVTRIQAPQVGIVGSEIRLRVSRGQSIKYHVPDSVEQYIYQNKLYSAG